MPRRKFIDKKNATTFKLVHRAQNDPLIHDAESSPFVFAEVQAPNNTRSSLEPSSSTSHQSNAGSARRTNASRGDLDVEFATDVRHNEGEAAEYGIYYDDTHYDYMQHMRNLGTGAGETVFVDANLSTHTQGKGKQKQSLEDALRETSLDDAVYAVSHAGSLASGISSSNRAASEIFDRSMLPSEYVKKTSYQDQQNIPDALAGFQPDMDERLREVLEALEDEAYVDEGEQGDFFEQFTRNGMEVAEDQWTEEGWDESSQSFEDDAGWETDDTVKPDQDLKVAQNGNSNVATVTGQSGSVTLPAPDEAPADREDTDWQKEFARFKASGKPLKAAAQDNPGSKLQSPSVLTGASSLLSTDRRKKRKGALTSTSGYSMSSSALQRTEVMSLLDQRFEKIAEEYADDELPDDGASLASGMTGMSKASGMTKLSEMSSMGSTGVGSAMRLDFDYLVDDFLGSHSTAGKSGRRVKRGRQQTGMEQLDEIREGLGKSRRPKAQVA